MLAEAASSAHQPTSDSEANGTESLSQQPLSSATHKTEFSRRRSPGSTANSESSAVATEGPVTSRFVPLQPLSPSALLDFSASAPHSLELANPQPKDIRTAPEPCSKMVMDSLSSRFYDATGFGLLQVANGASFAFQLLVLQIWGRDIGRLSDKYQTFVTPAGFAFAIWGIIFAAESINAVYQLFPSQRGPSNILVQRISWFFVSAQLFQAGWCITWHYELIYLASCCMFGIYVSLAVVLFRLDAGRLFTLAQMQIAPVNRIEVTWLQWALYFVPFQLHFGWITAASAISCNIPLRALDMSFENQFGAAVSTLGAVLVSACFWVYTRHEIIHSLVLTWALFALGVALHDPDRSSLPFKAAGQPYTLALGMGAWINGAICFLISVLGALWALSKYRQGSAEGHLLRHQDLMEPSLKEESHL